MWQVLRMAPRIVDRDPRAQSSARNLCSLFVIARSSGAINVAIVATEKEKAREDFTSSALTHSLAG